MTNFTEEQPLTYQIVENGTIFPCHIKDGKICAGIFDSEGKLVEESLLFRKNIFGEKDQVICPAERNTINNSLNDTYIFGGYLPGHYGHFLLESLANLWYIKKYPELPIIWLTYVGMNPFNGTKSDDFKSWQKELFSLLNIKNKHIILDDPSFVKKIIIPQSGCILQDYFAIEQAEALGVYKVKEPIKGRKIWLSRSQLNPMSSLSLIDNEKHLEDILEQQGWFIFHAQKYNITQQLEILASAEHIAGFEGSAFHTLVLLDQLKAKITIFGRGNLGQKFVVNGTYTMIAETKKFRQNEYAVHLTKTKERTNTHGAEVFMIHSYKEIIDLLNNTGV